LGGGWGWDGGLRFFRKLAIFPHTFYLSGEKWL
jgi:hypothetical protein